jgi:hypothetical protein
MNKNKVVILGCVNKDIIEKVKKLSDDNKAEFVLLNDKVVTDYIESKEIDNSKTEKEKLNKFLSNDKNRKEVSEKAILVWNILTNNGDISQAPNIVLSKTVLVKKSTLDFNQATELLDLLYAFGFLKYTNGKREFKLIFNDSIRVASAYLDVISKTNEVKLLIDKYIGFLKLDKTVSVDNQKNLLDNLKKSIYNILK